MTKRALITGIRGQDGAYIAKFLLDTKATQYSAPTADYQHQTSGDCNI